MSVKVTMAYPLSFPLSLQSCLTQGDRLVILPQFKEMLCVCVYVCMCVWRELMKWMVCDTNLFVCRFHLWHNRDSSTLHWQRICCTPQPGSWTAQRCSGGGASLLSVSQLLFQHRIILAFTHAHAESSRRFAPTKEPTGHGVFFLWRFAEVWHIFGQGLLYTNYICDWSLSPIAVCGERRGVESQLSCLGSGALATPLGTSTHRSECCGKLNYTDHLACNLSGFGNITMINNIRMPSRLSNSRWLHWRDPKRRFLKLDFDVGNCVNDLHAL